jgi:hypothetical protein
VSWQLVTEPIDRWPEKDTNPRDFSRFKSTYSQTLQILTRELDFLKAKGPVVMQVVTRLGDRDLRRDGQLRAGTRIEHPGVRLSFTCPVGDLTYATDRFRNFSNSPGWEENLRAIALGLEALRTVDRYGISKSGEQYRGWAAVPAAGAIEATGMTREDAAKLLATLAVDPPGEPDHDVEVRRILGGQGHTALKHAQFAAHPDRNNGNRTLWDQVDLAAKVLQLI